MGVLKTTSHNLLQRCMNDEGVKAIWRLFYYSSIKKEEKHDIYKTKSKPSHFYQKPC